VTNTTGASTFGAARHGFLCRLRQHLLHELRLSDVLARDIVELLEFAESFPETLLDYANVLHRRKMLGRNAGLINHRGFQNRPVPSAYREVLHSA